MKKLLASIILISLLCSCGVLEPATGEGFGRTDVSKPSSGVYAEASASTNMEPSPSESASQSVETGNAPAGTEGNASYDGSEMGNNLTYTTYLGKVITDFSFLDGLSKNFFSDTTDKEKGSWYCGKTVRNHETGEVTVEYDRAKDVLDAMREYNVIYRKNEDSKVIYLTFDCGYEPENGYTDEILDILKDKNVKGSFFLNGQFIKTRPDLVKRMLDEGHVVGNHGNNHAVMSKLTLEELFYEVESNNALLQSAVPGAPYMKYFRPSYGSCSPWDLALYEAMDLQVVQYSWTYYDYVPADQMEPAVALQRMKDGLHNGSVLLFHTVGSTNVEVLDDFIDWVRAEGYEVGDITK